MSARLGVDRVRCERAAVFRSATATYFERLSLLLQACGWSETF
jgi:hypothetical protein